MNFQVDVDWKFKGFAYDSLEFLHSLDPLLTLKFLRQLYTKDIMKMTDQDELIYLRGLVIEILKEHYQIKNNQIELYEGMYDIYIANREATFKLEALKEIERKILRSYDSVLRYHRVEKDKYVIRNNKQYVDLPDEIQYQFHTWFQCINFAKKTIEVTLNSLCLNPLVVMSESQYPLRDAPILDNDIVLMRNPLKNIEDTVFAFVYANLYNQSSVETVLSITSASNNQLTYILRYHFISKHKNQSIDYMSGIGYDFRIKKPSRTDVIDKESKIYDSFYTNRTISQSLAQYYLGQVLEKVGDKKDSSKDLLNILQNHPNCKFNYHNKSFQGNIVEDEPTPRQQVIINHNAYLIPDARFNYFQYSDWIRKTLGESSQFLKFFNDTRSYQKFMQNLWHFRAKVNKKIYFNSLQNLDSRNGYDRIVFIRDVERYPPDQNFTTNLTELQDSNNRECRNLKLNAHTFIFVFNGDLYRNLTTQAKVIDTMEKLYESGLCAKIGFIITTNNFTNRNYYTNWTVDHYDNNTFNIKALQAFFLQFRKVKEVEPQNLMRYIKSVLTFRLYGNQSLSQYILINKWQEWIQNSVSRGIDPWAYKNYTVHSDMYTDIESYHLAQYNYFYYQNSNIGILPSIIYDGQVFDHEILQIYTDERETRYPYHLFVESINAQFQNEVNQANKNQINDTLNFKKFDLNYTQDNSYHQHSLYDQNIVFTNKTNKQSRFLIDYESIKNFYNVGFIEASEREEVVVTMVIQKFNNETDFDTILLMMRMQQQFTQNVTFILISLDTELLKTPWLHSYGRLEALQFNHKRKIITSLRTEKFVEYLQPQIDTTNMEDFNRSRKLDNFDTLILVNGVQVHEVYYQNIFAFRFYITEQFKINRLIMNGLQSDYFNSKIMEQFYYLNLDKELDDAFLNSQVDETHQSQQIVLSDYQEGSTLLMFNHNINLMSKELVKVLSIYQQVQSKLSKYIQSQITIKQTRNYLFLPYHFYRFGLLEKYEFPKEQVNFVINSFQIQDLVTPFKDLEVEFDTPQNWILVNKNMSHYYNAFLPSQEWYIGKFGTWNLDVQRFITDKPTLSFALQLKYIVGEVDLQVMINNQFIPLFKPVKFSANNNNKAFQRNFTNFGSYLQMILPSPGSYHVEVTYRNYSNFTYAITRPYKDIQQFNTTYAILLSQNNGTRDERELLKQIEVEKEEARLQKIRDYEEKLRKEEEARIEKQRKWIESVKNNNKDDNIFNPKKDKKQDPKPQNLAKAGFPEKKENIKYIELQVFHQVSGGIYEVMLMHLISNINEEWLKRNRTQILIKHWFQEQTYLSPQAREQIEKLQKFYEFEYGFWNTKWPLHWHQESQSGRRFMYERNLFMDNIFPDEVAKAIYFDSDQLLFDDPKLLYNWDLEGNTFAMVPHCNNNQSMFLEGNFWSEHLKSKGLEYMFAGMAIYDIFEMRWAQTPQTWRNVYNDRMNKNPRVEIFANADQDLINEAQPVTGVYYLPEEWGWTEGWCDKEILKKVKLIDLHGHSTEKKEYRIIKANSYFPEYHKNLEDLRQIFYPGLAFEKPLVEYLDQQRYHGFNFDKNKTQEQNDDIKQEKKEPFTQQRNDEL